MENNKIESPGEMEILIHYHCSPDPWPNNSPHHQQVVEKHIGTGLLKEKDGLIVANTEATQALMDKVQDIEIPKQIWK